MFALKSGDISNIHDLHNSGGSTSIKGLDLLSEGKPTNMKGYAYRTEGQKAVDGKVDGNTRRTSPASSKGNSHTNNWWEVYLQGTYPIYLVLVHNRWDRYAEQIHGAEVKVGSTSCGTIKYHRDVKVYAINCKGTKGNTVRIEQNKNNLVLPEVQVYGRAAGGDLGAFYTGQSTGKFMDHFLVYIFYILYIIFVTDQSSSY